MAETFLERLPLTALVLTKMDGDARGGAALSIRSMTGLPVAFVGTGEAVDALDVFHPDRLAQRILGMGDIVTLVERAEERIDRDEAERAAQRLMEARFTLEDFRSQLQQVKKMGPIGQILEMVPGGAGLAGAAQAAVDDGELKRIEAIIDSMTPDRAAGAARHQGQPSAADRGRQRDDGVGRQPPPPPVRGDAEARSTAQWSGRSSRRADRARCRACPAAERMLIGPPVATASARRYPVAAPGSTSAPHGSPPDRVRSPMTEGITTWPFTSG